MLKLINIKLSGFTVIELLIALMLGGVVVGLTYLYFTQFQKYLRDTRETEASYSQGGGFAFVVENDFTNARGIYVMANNELSIDMDSSQYNYLFTNKKIIRSTANATDTFSFAKVDVDFKYYAEKYSNLLQSLEMEIEPVEGKKENLVLVKEYAAVTFFQLFREERKNGN